MTDENKPIWQRKTVDETLQMYADWAKNYDEDVTTWGYATPARISTALARHLTDLSAPILDFGCGTGLSGLELSKVGYSNIDGTDISEHMLGVANSRGIYKNLTPGLPGEISFKPGDYAAITAMGVISIGAAPPDTLRLVLGGMQTGGLLAMSYNDATLIDQEFMDILEAVQREGLATMIFDEYGDHLPNKDMKSRVYILEKT